MGVEPEADPVSRLPSKTVSIGGVCPRRPFRLEICSRSLLSRVLVVSRFAVGLRHGDSSIGSAHHLDGGWKIGSPGGLSHVELKPVRFGSRESKLCPAERLLSIARVLTKLKLVAVVRFAGSVSNEADAFASAPHAAVPSKPFRFPFVRHTKCFT